MFYLRSWRIWAVSFLCWTIYGSFGALGSLAYLIRVGARPTSQVILYNFAAAYLWAVLTPPLFLFAKRCAFGRANWKGPLAAHIVTGLVLATLVAAAIIEWNTLLGVAATEIPFSARLIDLLCSNVPLCFAIMGIAQAAEYYERFREREKESSRLEARLALAQLEILRSQLEPHFLFNTLNSIAALTQSDPVSAERMTLKLSTLLRASLDRNGSQEVSLQQELDFLQSYLDIQQTRFRDRLTIQISVDPSLLSASIPSMLLQPLVENSIRHGIAKSAAPGCIRISVSKEEELIKIAIVDNGIGMESDGSGESDGYGLRNTRARLDQLYGSGHKFRIDSSPGNGCCITLDLPLVPASNS